MVRGRRIRVVWATTCRCQFPPRLVADLAVTQGKGSVCLGRSKRAVLVLCVRRSCLYDCPAIVKCYIYVGYGYPEIDLMKLFSNGKSIVIIRKCVKELISV